MNKNIKIIIISLMLFSCAKKEIEVTPEVVEKIVLNEEFVRMEKEAFDSTILLPEENLIIDTLVNNVSDSVKVDIPEIDLEAAIIEPQASIIKELDYDELFPDSVWTEYMTKRGDYLSLIAYKEFNNANEWRRIYNWNRDDWEEKGIGPDRDNPNFIYPYKELDLKKPTKDAIEWAYEYYIHIVDENETLWTIAKKEYGDELAWVVLFWDNEKILDSQEGKLIPGMKLKVRSELWPDVDQD
jgi:nucleoid-associated protein YgaU